MFREVPIRGETIRLGQLLKLVVTIDSGSEAKTFLAVEPVWVNEAAPAGATAGDRYANMSTIDN
jgi:ribosome-associated protein YbcJ (S4-like RNA binding protein)